MEWLDKACARVLDWFGIKMMEAKPVSPEPWHYSVGGLASRPNGDEIFVLRQDQCRLPPGIVGQMKLAGKMAADPNRDPRKPVCVVVDATVRPWMVHEMRRLWDEIITEAEDGSLARWADDGGR
jgi:hypothetical protein